MAAALTPPVEPMLAALARTLPEDEGYLFEPKWDGFRCLAFRDGDEVDLRSRNQRPFARYFPEVVDALRALGEERFVIDGELVTEDFPSLLARTHPAASRVAKLAAETPATFIAFDVLARGNDVLCDAPFEQRRFVLESLLRDAPTGLRLTPATEDRDAASSWLDARSGAIDGVVAKRRDLRYQPGKRAMVKVKRERTVDCVVAGMRLFADRSGVSSLLLGLYDADGDLVHVGVAAGFARARRLELVHELRSLAVPIDEHPWRRGFGASGSIGRLPGAASRWTPDMELDWLPLRPERVAEVAYDHLEGVRFRHPGRLKRWRPDRDAASCRLEQLT
jgi:ATP-dependent DNA ligase